ncbi:hypothetical protein EDD15DRAFT_2372706 [Pisolithus albus]|nr:hypothetical protein EDD15DRAFT_2372706 [Pisolithus albus]
MNFIAKWCDDICEVLRTDPRSLLGGRHYELAHIIKEECTQFLDPAVLAMYLLPLTSWSDGHSPVIVTGSRQPDLQSLAAFCLQRLSWSRETVQSELEAACAGMAMRTLLQLPGNANSEGLRRGLQVSSYCDDGPLPTYRISVPSRPLAMPLDPGPSPIVHMSPPGDDGSNDSFYEMEIPAVVLEYSWPDLAQVSARLSSQLPRVELKGKDVGDRSLSPEAGVRDSMNED